MAPETTNRIERPLTGKPLIQAWRRLELLLGRRKAVAWLILALLVPLLWFTNVFSTEWIDLAIIDGLRGIESRFRSPDPALAIVEIDGPTLKAAGKPWPWPRRDLANLIGRLQQGSPKLVVLDIVLQHLDPRDGAGDALLVEAIASAGNVALVSLLEESVTGFGVELNHFRNAECFRKAACIEGFVRTLSDPDGMFRWFPCRDERLGIDSCALQVVARLRPQALSENGRPPDESLLAFAERDGGIPRFSAAGLLDGSFPLERLRDRIVTLGVTDPESRDYFSTPAGIKPGVALLAASINTLLQGKSAVRLNDWLWRGLAVGSSLFLCFAGSGAIFDGRGRRRILVFVALSLGLMVGSALLGRYPPFGLWLLTWFWTHLVWLTGQQLLEFMDFQAVKVEAAAAREVQGMIFPSSDWKDERGFWCRTLIVPSDEVGGDYVDFQKLPDGSLVFIMSDVAGHGFPAALVTAAAKTCTMLLKRWDLLTPTNLTLTLNSLLCDFLRKRRIMTALIGHLNPVDGKVVLVFNGSPPAYLVANDGSTREIGESARPLGASENLNLRTVEVSLASGETLVLYTDGIPEALDWEERQYGYPAWQECLGRRVATMGEDAPLQDILTDVQHFTGGRPFPDDIALLLVGRKGA